MHLTKYTQLRAPRAPGRCRRTHPVREGVRDGSPRTFLSTSNNGVDPFVRLRDRRADYQRKTSETVLVVSVLLNPGWGASS